MIDWLLTNFGLTMSLEMKNIMFTKDKNNKLMNYLYIVAKYYVYAIKFPGRELTVESFKSVLLRKFQSEKYIAYLNDTFTKFVQKWSVLYNYLNQKI